jgi:hypothetical protein
MSDEKKEKKDNGGLEAVARKALEIGNAVAAEVRKLKEQLVNEGVISNPAATMSGAEAFRAKGKGGHIKLTALVGVAMLCAAITGGLWAANELVWKVGDSAYVDAEGDATFNSVTASTFTGTLVGPVGGAVSATTLSASGATRLSGSVTVIGSAVTTRWDNASSKIDGEAIADDTIDDDSIDFSDVTGADLTLTDCGAVGATTLAASGASTLSGAVTVIGGSVTTRWDNASSLIDTAAIEVGPLSATTLAASGATALSGTVRYTGVSVNVTNGQELVTTLARGTYLYTPTEVATNTVANPTGSGDWVAFINVGTNDMVVAKAANLALGGATRTLGTYDILVLRAASAAVWVEESFTDNTLGP